MNELHIKLQNYSSTYPEEIVTKTKMLEFLNEYENPFSRDLQIGHFTASAFLLNNDKTKFLLMHHKKLDKWLQPGGHCDGDSNILNVAVKEAVEESGINEIKTINKEIFDIDTHYILQTHKEPAHYHYDVRFLLKTVNNNNFIKNNESNELKWFNFSDYSKLDIELERSVTRMIEKFMTINHPAC